MGPLDQPPMVTAQGYTDPSQPTIGAPTAPMDQNAMLAELLRRRNAASKQAQMSAGNAQMWGNDFQRPQFSTTTRGAAGQPDQVNINWGDILGKGVSNYMGASERKKALDSQDEVKNISDQFMQTTLASDPTAQKLYGLTQAGMPGADKALATHLAPKKQTLADLTQFIVGGGSPEMAAEIAKSKGIDPQIAFRAAEYQAKNAEQKSTDKFSQQATLQGMKTEGQNAVKNSVPGKTGYTPAELAAMPIEQRLAAVQASSGRETAESKERGKMKVAAEQEVPRLDQAITSLKDIVNFADKADYWPGNLGLKGNTLTSNSSNVMLRQAISKLVLAATATANKPGGTLGGGVSNADVKFLQGAQAELDSGNRATVVAQLNDILSRWSTDRDRFAKLIGSNAQKPDVANGPSSQFDYTATKNMKKQPQADTFEEDAAGMNFGQ